MVQPFEENYVKLILSQLLPPSDMSIDDHAKEYYLIPSGNSAMPGYFDIDNTPYLKAVMDAVHFSSDYKEVVLMKSAQIGGTSVTLCFLLWMMETGQESPTLVVLPTERVADRFVKSKFRPMVENCISLQGKMSQIKNRENTLNLVSTPCGSVCFANSHAPNSMRMDSCRVVIYDEVSDYPADNGQGDPVEIARARTTTFERNKKLFLVSTPNIEETCRITAAYNDTDQRKFFVPCPHCGEYQTIEWKNIKFKDLDDVHLKCQHCDKKIYEEAKRWMLRRGEWRPTAEHKDKTKIGFHINALYSLIGDSWESIAREFLASKDDANKLQVWRNNKLGLPFKGSIEISRKQLYKRVEKYEISPRLPKGVDLVTCGVDFNEHFTNLEFVGWGRDYQSWGLEYLKLEKHISDPTLWMDVNELLSRTFTHYKGRKIKVACSVLDSGYAADTVWNFVSKFQGDGRNIIAIKGVEGVGERIISTKPSLSKKNNVPFYRLSSHTSNETLFSWLNVKNSELAGYCRFPKSYLKTDYFEELTAMSKLKVGKGRNPVGRWVQDMSKRCEANDCRRMAIAGLYHLTHLGFDLASHCEFFKGFDFEAVNEQIQNL